MLVSSGGLLSESVVEMLTALCRVVPHILPECSANWMRSLAVVLTTCLRYSIVSERDNTFHGRNREPAKQLAESPASKQPVERLNCKKLDRSTRKAS